MSEWLWGMDGERRAGPDLHDPHDFLCVPWEDLVLIHYVCIPVLLCRQFYYFRLCVVQSLCRAVQR